MIIGRALRRAAVAAGAVVAAGCFQVAPASAQLFWDWGGGSMVDGSGREVVRFSPQFPKGQIIVSFGDRRLYFITKPGEAISYPIAIPREESRWQGNTTVTSKRENPSWTPTPTMIAENPRLPRWVPGGHPMNPLGVRALYLGSSTYRIHGTDAPWTIGSAVSKGCIRMYNQDVLDLYPRASVGAKVIVTWQKYGAVASNGGGSFFGSSDDDEAPPATRSAVKKVSKVQKQ
jgi:lipoprotein-anchoring transpeptidase ErfK/SrfK